MPTQASHGFSVGDVIRHNGTIWVKAQADSAANAESIAVVESTSDANNFLAVTHGKITLSGLTAGVYYLSDATAGLLTQTPPSADGTINKSVLYAISSTVAYVTQHRGVVNAGAIGITIDGAGLPITTGIKGYVRVPYNCTINSNELVADQSGSIVIDVIKDTYANFPPTDSPSDSICASALPTLSTQQKSQDGSLTGWTTSLTAGDYLGFVVDSASTVTQVSLYLIITKT